MPPQGDSELSCDVKYTVIDGSGVVVGTPASSPWLEPAYAYVMLRDLLGVPLPRVAPKEHPRAPEEPSQTFSDFERYKYYVHTYIFACSTFIRCIS